MTKILITGANSFLGTNFKRLTEFKHIDEVCLINNRLEDLDFSETNVILHVAAIVHQTKKIPPSTYFEVNRDLAISVAEKAKREGVKQFVFISTVKVFGENNTKLNPWNEESPCNPADSYGKSKLAAEIALQKLIDGNFTVSIIRPPLLYGVGVKANMLSLIKLIDRFPILPLGGIDNQRSMTSIDNLVQLIDVVIKKRISGIFLAMDSKALSTSEIASYIKHSLNKNTKLIKLPKFLLNLIKIIFSGIYYRLYGTFLIDNSHTCKILDYSPTLDTKQGINKMVQNYLNK